MKGKLIKQIVLVGGILSIPLSYFNAVQEGSSYFASAVICLWSIVPFILLYTYTNSASKSETIDCPSLIISIFGSGIGVFAYASYYFGGRSNPDTAAHMHVVFFPALHIFLMVCFGIIIRILTAIFSFIKKLST